LLIALSCEVEDFYSAVVFTKENVAAKALADQISDLNPPTQMCFGRLLGRIEEGGEAYATRIGVRCNDRNRIIAHKRIIIATGGSATAELSMRRSTFNQWLSKVWMAFMDERELCIASSYSTASSISVWRSQANAWSVIQR